MTNTKFRKRALLSSVAMLLVALVALGSATFAWFQANPNSSASGIKLKATASTGLVVQSGTEKAINSDWWSHNAVFRTSGWDSTDSEFKPETSALSVSPASFCPDGTNKGNLYRVDAAAEDNYIAADNATVGTTQAGTDYYTEKLYMKVTGANSATVNLMSITIDQTSVTGNLKNAIRVAVVYKGNVIGVYAPESNASNKYLTATGTYKIADDPETAGVDESDGQALSKTAYNFTAAGTLGTSSAGVTIGNVSDAGTDALDVYVYLDGEDARVRSNNIASADLNAIVAGITLQLKAV